jgi:ubiquinone/menaquinone biosynthesis C-methylase UbiE
MTQLAQKRIADTSFPVDLNVLSGESLPFVSESFDSVVSTWTLCSITNIDQALQEIHRVLKPQGRFFFIEHGLSDNPNVQKWQHRLTPIQKIVGDGCRLNRDMRALIHQHFTKLEIKNFKLEDQPEIIGYLYQGIATKQMLTS